MLVPYLPAVQGVRGHLANCYAYKARDRNFAKHLKIFSSKGNLVFNDNNRK